jgi:cation/acetate symporter
MVLFTMSLMIGTAGLPHVIIRFFTVPKVSDARQVGGLGAGVHRAALHRRPGGRCDGAAEHHHHHLPRNHGPADIDLEQADGLRGSSGLDAQLGADRPSAFEDKNNDGLIQYYNAANPEFQAIAEELGWEGNEMVTFNQDILVLANPEIAQLPGWVIALIAAGGLAAALSTAAGLLLAISSAISHDLIKSMINPGISEKGELLAARISMAFAIALATWLGLNPPGFAAQVVALAFGLAARRSSRRS